MMDTMGNVIASRIQRTHEMMLAVTAELSDAQLAQQPGPTSPPIGWHLWHVARWADRLQASLAAALDDPQQQGDPKGQIWEREGMAARWQLDAAALGLLQTGAGMTVEMAASLARVGGGALLDYARRTFSAVDRAIAGLDTGQLDQPRKSILAFRIEGGSVTEAPGAETTLGADLVFHLTHTNRHLGMIEALRGATLGLRGTASV